MLTHLISQFRRRPLPALAVILFAVVISFALGGLQQSNDAERESYETIYETTPVTFAVTDLYGEDSGPYGDDVGWIRSWITDTFTGTGVSEPYLAEYVTDLKMELTKYISKGEYSGYTLSGITSAATAPLLDSACGAQVTWFDGYDESSIEKDEFICVIPQSLYETLGPDTKELKLVFYFPQYQGRIDPITGEVEEKAIYRTFSIAGTYESIKREYSIYCPFIKVRRIYSELEDDNIYVSSIKGSLKDNYRLEEFKAAAANWFAEPNPTGEKTPWGRWGYEYYLYALDIKDTVLQRVTHNYQISMVINRLSFALVFAFSAAAGFFIGFLLIRSRKREIGLMRTLGSSNARICLGFAAEQLLCVAAGILLGGALMDFNAPRQLALFALVYFIGLSAALIVFLHRNLISTMKEDE